MKTTMLDAADFPLVCYGAALFRATDDVPLIVAPTRELAEAIGVRLNAMFAVEIVLANDDGNDDDERDRRISRVVRGVSTIEDFPVAPEPETVEEPGWTLPGQKG